MGEAGQPPQPVHLGPVRHGRVAEVELLQLRHLRPRAVQPRHRALGQRHRVQAADSNMVKFKGQIKIQLETGKGFNNRVLNGPKTK